MLSLLHRYENRGSETVGVLPKAIQLARIRILSGLNLTLKAHVASAMQCSSVGVYVHTTGVFCFSETPSQTYLTIHQHIIPRES